MIRIAWRSILAHKLRAFLTTLAILLGVAMISGTYVLTDQIDRGFKEIFGNAYKGVDVTVTRRQAFGGAQMTTTRGLPESVLTTIAAVDGVADVRGYIEGAGAVAVRGKVVETRGAPVLFFGSSGQDATTQYVAGRYPSRPGEVGVVKKLADGQGLKVGSRLTVLTAEASETVRVSGVFTFGAEASLGGTLLVQSTLADAQRWFGLEGRVTRVDVRAEPGVPAETLRRRVEAALGPEAEVRTGAQAAADETKALSDAIGKFLRPALLSFGGVAVFVGAFIIFNAFSMTVAQRQREFAMLRALGASRAQVLWTLAGEALLTGVLASVAGLFAGLGVATAVNEVFKALDIDIPRSGLVMAPRTVAVSLAVGISVTLASALVPAWRATRVPPVAALQEGAVLPPTRFARYTPYAAAALAAAGVGLLLLGMYGSGSTTTRLGIVGAGAVGVFVAVAMVSKYVVRPVAGVLGWPLQKVAPVTGRLARDNSRRNPGRTALTASALMVGLAVVVFVAVFAQGMKSSFIDSFDATVRGDLIVQSKNYLAMPAQTLRLVEGAPSVEVAAGLSGEQAQAGRERLLVPVYGVEPVAFDRVWRFDWLAGETSLAALGGDGVAVEEQTAASLGLEVGDRVLLRAAEGGRREFTVRGIYRDPMMLNGMTLTQYAYDGLFPKRALYMVVAKARPGRDVAAVKRDVQRALAGIPVAEVQTRAGYKDKVIGLVNQLLNLLYGLLAMSVVISVFGIVNTLVLSVYERTREIGLCRAIGMSRGQVRATVRYESVITSLIGAAMGIVVGILFAWVVTTRFAGQGIVFDVPGGQLVVFLFVGVVVGVVAAILPARRAARIDILEAIHYE